MQQRNEELVEEVRALEDRTRRRDILVEDEALFAFYDARVPADPAQPGSTSRREVPALTTQELVER